MPKTMNILLVAIFLISMISPILAASTDPPAPLPPLANLYTAKQLDAIEEGLITKTEIKNLRKEGMKNVDIDEKLYPTKIYPEPAAYEEPEPTFKEEAFTYFPLIMGAILGALIGYFIRFKTEKSSA